MKEGQIMTCKEYNDTEAIERYEKSDGRNPAFYFWYNLDGSLRQYGYVGKTKRALLWDKTKKKLIKRMEAKK